MIETAISDSVGIFPELLEFGFMGLSVAVLLLAFFLFYKVVSAETVAPVKARMAIIFLCAAFVFMIGAGVLRFVDSSRQVSVILQVTPWYESYPERYGVLYVTHGVHDQGTLDTSRKQLNVKEGSVIGLEITKLKEKFDDYDQKIKIFQRQLQDINATLKPDREDVGVDVNGGI